MSRTPTRCRDGPRPAAVARTRQPFRRSRSAGLLLHHLFERRRRAREHLRKNLVAAFHLILDELPDSACDLDCSIAERLHTPIALSGPWNLLATISRTRRPALLI